MQMYAHVSHDLQSSNLIIIPSCNSHNSIVKLLQRSHNNGLMTFHAERGSAIVYCTGKVREDHKCISYILVEALQRRRYLHNPPNS